MGNLPPGALLNNNIAKAIIGKHVNICGDKMYVYDSNNIIYTIYGHSDYDVEGVVENVALEWIDHPTSYCFCLLFCQRTVRLHRMKIKIKGYATITMYSVDGWHMMTGLG